MIIHIFLRRNGTFGLCSFVFFLHGIRSTTSRSREELNALLDSEGRFFPAGSFTASFCCFYFHFPWCLVLSR